MSKNRLIPELRFPEFVNDGEWEKKELSELGVLINGLTYSPSDVQEKGLLVLRSSNIQNGQIDLHDCVFVNPDVKGVNLTEPDDILVCVRNGSKALIGKNAIIPIGLPLATHGAFMTIFRAKYPKFAFQLFQTDNYYNQVNADLGATINSINGKNFLKYKFIVPKPQEQQKIASCLSSLDEVISAHIQKLEALKEHKKGMMQNLFPQEGETVPKWRFKEFKNDKIWKEKKLNYYLELLTDFEANGSFADVKANVTVSDEPNFAWYVRSTDLEKKSNLESVKYVDEHSYNFLNKTKLFGGELLITKRGEIGKVYIYMPFKNLPATVAPNMYLLKLNEKAEPKFFYFHFTNNKGNQSLKRLNASSTIGALYKDDVKNIIVYVPSLCEQQKIASCLSSIDALITAQAKKIEQLKLHKKGLMQGLFPKVNN